MHEINLKLVQHEGKTKTRMKRVLCNIAFSVLYDMEPNQTTLHVGYDENLFGGDSYYLQIDHVCPCSNVTSGNACEWTMDPRISLCIDLEDKMKGPPPTDDTFRLDLGEVDLSTPWKYYRCPSTVAPCLP